LGLGAPSQAASPIVIGGTISQTGALAEDADYQAKGIQLAVDEANEHGGWLGRKLELKIYDDQSNSGTAVRLYTRLITEDRVNLLIGPYSSGITQAIAPLMNKYKMATIEPGASMPDISVKGNEWNFQGTASSYTYLDELLPIAKKAGEETVAVLALKSAFTLACSHARLEQAKQLGMKVVYQTTYSLPSPDFAAIGLAIKNANPDVVLGCTYFPDAVGITQSLHNQGFKPKYLAETVGPVEAAFGKALGPLANGIISNTSWWPTFKTPGSEAFVAAYKAKFNQAPDYHAATGFASVEVLGAAVNATKSLDQEKLREWLLHHSVPTLLGDFKVNEDGLSTGYGQYLVQWQNGQIKLITPDSLAEAKLMVPYPGS
ncbi:MAG TPA: amino acid ABC transporter substrate-binding protein, partial [Acetobacteraceae bacterium]|nr:amino acid ABC transporter substrate-binding protein [Acetobacteraceae bacterium]